MQISSMLNEGELKDCQQKLYEYFETGYMFEDFLGKYLFRIGLDEIEVTQRSRDGGIDLRAVRGGIGGFGGLDSTLYLVQAKRYIPSSKISVSKIRELRGKLFEGNVGLFITTSDFTKDAYNEAVERIDKPIVPINGEKLVTSCIDNEIGFIFKPLFDRKQMDLFLDSLSKGDNAQNVIATDVNTEQRATGMVEKLITANDLRARIISIPKSIMDKLGTEREKIVVSVNDKESYECTINRQRNYLSRVVQIFKDVGLIDSSGIAVPKTCYWEYDGGDTVKLKI